MIPATRYETRSYHDYSPEFSFRCIKWWLQSKLYNHVKFYWDKEQLEWCREVSGIRCRRFTHPGVLFADGVNLTMITFHPEPGQLITRKQVVFDSETTPEHL